MKKILEKIVILVIILSLLAYSGRSIATSSSELNNLRNEQSSVTEQIEQTEEDLKDIATEKSEALEQVEKLTSQISSYQSEIDDLEEQIGELKEQISEVEEQIAKDEAEYKKQDEALDARLVAMYKTGETSYLDFMLSSASLVDFISSYYLISQVADYDTKMLEQLEAHKEKIESEKAELETAKADLESSEKTLTAKQQALQVAKKEKEAYYEKLSDEEKELEEELEQLEKENREMEAKIKAAEAKYAAQLEALRNSSSANVTTGSGYFIKPVSGGYVSCYGYYSSGRFHGAIDYAVPMGTTVMAAADGVVVKTENLTYSYGTYVVILHANGMRTYYGHGTRGSICVSEGEIVKQGQKIMLSGSTGNSSGPHVHFEVRKPVYSSSGEATYPYNTYATAYGQDSRVNPALYL